MTEERIVKIKRFLEDYKKLCQKYKMGLRGCGCCGSPYLDSDHYNIDDSVDDINYKAKENTVTISYKTIEEYFNENYGKYDKYLVGEKIKIIDLLYRIANKEEVPEVIYYSLNEKGYEYYKWNKEEQEYICTTDEKDFFSVPNHHLNDEVTIIKN